MATSKSETSKPHIEQPLSVAEKSETVWVPLAGPEIRAGYRLGDDLDLSLGLALLVLLPGQTRRLGSWAGSPEHRAAPIPAPNGMGNLGVVSLPDEQALGTDFCLDPSLSPR